MREARAIVDERIVALNRKGIFGAELYDALAVDEAVPAHLNTVDVCEITGDTSNGLKQRRQRGLQPAFIRVSGRRVLYPRFELFTWLRDRYVARAG